MGSNIVQEVEEKVRIVHEKLLTGQSYQKGYYDNLQRELKFSVGGHMFLNVCPTRRVKCFGMREKLSPRYIWPFEVLEQIGHVAYLVVLPVYKFGRAHNMLHMLLLNKYVPDPTHIIRYPPLEL